jgi:DNA recombination protein RmuC
MKDDIILLYGAVGVATLVIFSFLIFIKLQKEKYHIIIENYKLLLQRFEEEYNIAALKITRLEEQILKEHDLNHELDKANELLKLKLQENLAMQEEWSSLKERSIENAKAVIFEVGNKLSSQLVEAHQRETENFAKRSQEKFAETTTNINKSFENITQTIGHLYSQVNDSKKTVDIVKQALLSPSTAGSLAEITLENILKNSFLVKEVDYIMQYSFASVENEQSYRPDAVVYLPGDNLMIIDSKASKFFIECSEDDNIAVKQKLVASMRNHLKSLISKNYKDAIKNSLGKNNRKFNHITMIMFLPSEKALEKLHELDHEFISKAWAHNIYPAGPIGVMNILSHARFQISQNNQIQNFQQIIDEINILIKNLSSFAESAKKMGTSIHSAANNYDKMASVFNNKIITKIKKLTDYGLVEKNNDKNLESLKRFQLVSNTPIEVIDVASDDEDADSDSEG